jgi:hypothetical protein
LPSGPVHVPDTDVIVPSGFPDCPLPAAKFPAMAADEQVNVGAEGPGSMSSVELLLSDAVQFPPGLMVQVVVAACAGVMAIISTVAKALLADRILARRFFIECPLGV